MFCIISVYCTNEKGMLFLNSLHPHRLLETHWKRRSEERKLGLPPPIWLRRRGDPIQGIESMGKYLNRFSSASPGHGVVEWRGAVRCSGGGALKCNWCQEPGPS
jgi:hypothetical protein